MLLGSRFGVLGSIFQSKHLLRELHQITNPDAVMLIENSHTEPAETSDGPGNSQVDSWLNTIPTQLRIRIRFQHYISDWFSHLTLTRKQLQYILEDTGWMVREIIESDTQVYIGVLEKVD